MYTSAFNKFYWGFFFIMLSFRIQGFDIIPNIIGYILIYQGLILLQDQSENFKQAKKFAIPIIVLSIFSIYDFQGLLEHRLMEFWGWFFTIIIGIISIIIDLKLVYHLFMGINDMAVARELHEIGDEAKKSWNNYKSLLIATLITIFLVFIPPVALVMLIGIVVASVIILIQIMKLMKKCRVEF